MIDIDLTRGIWLKPEYQSRIGHRYSIIRKLSKLIDESNDQNFIESARQTIEQKAFEIETILSTAPRRDTHSP